MIESKFDYIYEGFSCGWSKAANSKQQYCKLKWLRHKETIGLNDEAQATRKAGRVLVVVTPNKLLLPSIVQYKSYESRREGQNKKSCQCV